MIGPPILGLLVDASGYSATIVIAMCLGVAAVPLLAAAERFSRASITPSPASTLAPQPPSPPPASTPAAPASAPAQPTTAPATAVAEPAQGLQPSPIAAGSVDGTLGPAGIDSLLLLSFGGPEGPDDVRPFLENVTRGRNVPADRLAQVETQYQRFGGVSPISGQNRDLLAALAAELTSRGTPLPCYWGNRNWHPYLRDTISQMAAEERRHTAVVVTSAFSSYSGCRQYHEDLAAAATAVPNAPKLTRVRVYGNHPGFVGAQAARVREALDGANLSNHVHALFTAHSLPTRMAAACDYELQLADAAESVAELAGLTGAVEVVYQSRSGPPQVPWLEPDVSDRLTQLGEQGCRTVLVVPLGFVSDHMEVLVDLDIRARATAHRAGINMVRAHAVGTHPLFVSALADLVEEAAGLRTDRPVIGELAPHPDACTPGCCPTQPAS